MISEHVPFVIKVAGRGLTFAITGSEKRCDEGAPLFTVRVDGVVMFRFQSAHGKNVEIVTFANKSMLGIANKIYPAVDKARQQESHALFFVSFLKKFSRSIERNKLPYCLLASSQLPVLSTRSVPSPAFLAAFAKPSHSLS